MTARGAVRWLVDRARPVAAPGPAAVGVVVAVQLWALRHLLRLVSWPNDLSFHASMVDWATGRFRAGQVPTDGWYPRLSGGLPQFHLYQSLPHVLTGLAGTVIGPERATHLALWLLVATWPVAVYLGARALGLSPLAAAAAAACSPLARSATGYGFEPYSYLWIGNGLWSQAWGMWVAPLALGWTARAVRTGAGCGRAVLAVGLTVAFHLPTAWFVLLALGLWLLVRPSEWRARLPRAAGLGVLSVLTAAWVLVPFLVDRWASNASSFNGQGSFADSFGWRRVGGWLLAGDVLDAHRIPVLSVAALAGLAVALATWRRSAPGGREVVALVGLSTVLFVGRDPFRLPIAALPGSSQVFLHRYVATLQLGLVLAVGLAVEAAWRWLASRPPEALSRPAKGLAAGVAVLALLATPVRSTARLFHEDASWVRQQERQDRDEGGDAAALVAIAQQRGGGRIFAGKLNGAGRDLRIGSVPAPIWLAHLPVDALGFTLRVSALAADLETYLDERSVADLDAFGIRYLLVRAGQEPPAGTWFLAARGDLQLWEVPGDGLVSTAHVLGPALPVGRDALAAELLPVLRAQGGSPTAVRLLDLEGRSPAVPTQRDHLDVPPGTLTGTRLDLEAGRLDTTTHFRTAGAVVVKANWHPRWQATVDGKPVAVAAVAPTWLAVPVGPGHHHVSLRYRPWPWTPPLVALAIAAVVAGWWWSGRARRAGARRAEGEVGVAADEAPAALEVPA
ncbi:YfhO family protein [Aquihabitans sp. G128]|uniref:YfhO family protein n=1 Tax=Aquihabitans sp. G128 TaxID=2849779 RepID=UPI001C250DB3|nr:YfhO family protein [Aquihabitans sp. G128]QXC60410.1 YfhO family protein [Aquihabitans sp. G128]